MFTSRSYSYSAHEPPVFRRPPLIPVFEKSQTETFKTRVSACRSHRATLRVLTLSSNSDASLPRVPALVHAEKRQRQKRGMSHTTAAFFMHQSNSSPRWCTNGSYRFADDVPHRREEFEVPLIVRLIEYLETERALHFLNAKLLEICSGPSHRSRFNFEHLHPTWVWLLLPQQSVTEELRKPRGARVT